MIKELTQDIETGSIDNFNKAINKLLNLLDELGINLRDYNKDLADTVDKFRGETNGVTRRTSKIKRTRYQSRNNEEWYW